MKRLNVLPALISVLFLVLIAWLCFFQFPSMDDFAGTYLKRSYGLGGAIEWYLKGANGRFASIPVFLTISSSKTLMGWYGFLLLGTLVITYFCLFFFVRVISRQWFEPALTGRQTAGIAALILVLFLNIVPEVSSFVFWMATGVTYLLPFAFFLLLICAYSTLLSAPQKGSWTWAIVIGLATCLLAGCNEIMLCYACALPFLMGLILVASKKKLPLPLIGIAILAVLILVVVMQLPGNKARAENYVQKQPLLTTAAGSFYRTWQALLFIFSSPLFYLSCIGILIAAGYLKKGLLIFFEAKKTHWLLEAGCIVSMIFCFDLVIRQIGSEVVPPRAINIILCLSLLGVWWIILLNAPKMQRLIHLIAVNRSLIIPVFSVTCSIALLGSQFSWQLMKNLVGAPIHAAVLKQRVDTIELAKEAGQQVVSIRPYREEVEKLVTERYKDKSRFVLEEFALPPSFSYFKDEPNKKELAYFYAEYYGIDTIAGAEGRFARWGLVERRLK